MRVLYTTFACVASFTLGCTVQSKLDTLFDNSKTWREKLDRERKLTERLNNTVQTVYHDLLFDVPKESESFAERLKDRLLDVLQDKKYESR